MHCGKLAGALLFLFHMPISLSHTQVALQVCASLMALESISTDDIRLYINSQGKFGKALYHSS